MGNKTSEQLKSWGLGSIYEPISPSFSEKIKEILKRYRERDIELL